MSEPETPRENPAIQALRDRLESESSDSLKLLASPAENPICSIQLDESLPGLAVTWKDYATSTQLRFVHEYLLHLIEQHRVTKIFGDDSALRTIVAEDQAWIVQDWMPRAVRAGLRAGAGKVSSAYFARLAVETIVAAAPEGLTLRVFGTGDEAKAWLRDFTAAARREAPTVLVVEDHDDTRQVVARLLQGDGYRVLTASGAVEALTLLEQTRPSLVITDYCMPGTSGLTLLAEIRKSERLRDVPVIMFSADEGAKHPALAAGVDAFILKDSMDWATLQREIIRLVGAGGLDRSLPHVPPARSKDAG